jgi:acetyl-CoA carboxylase carboxyltransferase component
MSQNNELVRRNTEAELGGGSERVARQHEGGKLTARERLNLLLDQGSFTEYDKFVTHRSSNFGLADKRYLGDGVITGTGTVQEAFATMFQNIGKAFIDMATQMIAQALVMKVLGILGGGIGGCLVFSGTPRCLRRPAVPDVGQALPAHRDVRCLFELS